MFRECLVVLLTVGVAAAAAASGVPLQGDWHYPSEEPAERAAAKLPCVRSVAADGSAAAVAATSGGATTNVTVPSMFQSWHVVAIVPDLHGAPAVVFEQKFARWALLAFVFRGDNTVPPLTLRKPVGELVGMRQPWYNFSDTYMAKAAADPTDFPAAVATNLSADGEPGFPEFSSVLAPQRDTVAISTAQDVVKFVVTHAGRVKCGARPPGDQTTGGIAELQDAWSPPPDAQKVVFDPAPLLPYWPHRYNATKVGIVGRYLNVANVGSFSSDVNQGYELVALSVPFAPPPPPCRYNGPLADAYVPDYPPGGRVAFATLAQALAACNTTAACGGVTLRSGAYELRASSYVMASPTGETSWLLVNASKATCHPSTPPKPACQYTGPLADTYVPHYTANGRQAYGTLQDAIAACNVTYSCSGITLRKGEYELRALPYTMPSPSGETSWLLDNATKAECHPLPRVAGINYAPLVYVQLRAQSAAKWSADVGAEYVAVSNSSSAPTPISAAKFFTALYTTAVREQAGVKTDAQLPGSDRRQADMAQAGILWAARNFIGNQSNYGFGATYWSVGREDNGSLPLNWLATDHALLDWGRWHTAAAHVGFFLDNYINADGSVNYYTWGAAGDSISDYGRVLDLFARIVDTGDAYGDSRGREWGGRYLPVAQRVAGRVAALASAAAGSSAPPGAANLLQGPPEHDWSSVKDLYFYNNNVWVAQGLIVYGALLQRTGFNATYGATLAAAGAKLQAAVSASVKQCAVADPRQSGLVFLPPYAHVNATPYANMTAGREASYSNFRFFPETLLVDTGLPVDVQRSWVTYHNAYGGSVGGASRWSTVPPQLSCVSAAVLTPWWPNGAVVGAVACVVAVQHLDDMPVAGWGRAALRMNNTAAFHALLYGHAANYQSRGSFHSTEQLSFLGTGLYRDFLHFTDPLPPANDANSTSVSVASLDDTAQPARVGSYFSGEQDISGCIVSEVLLARLTRWQLVFEAGGTTPLVAVVWLGRGAPKRWFKPGTGFSVTDAVTRSARLSYRVEVVSATQATYSLQARTVYSGVPAFVMRWPGQLSCTPTVGAGSACSISSVDAAGFVTVVLADGTKGAGAQCEVTACWK